MLRVRQRVAEFTRHYESARFDDSVEDARRLPELYEEIAAKQSSVVSRQSSAQSMDLLTTED